MLKKDDLNRLHHKSADGAFLSELRHGYELSPKLSEQILLTARMYLTRTCLLKEGQIEVSVIGYEERSGKLLEQMSKCPVRLTIDAGYEDHEVLRDSGRVELRRYRLQRICEEALDQRGVLSQEDLSRYLNCSVRTIKRDIKTLKFRGIAVVTRGVLHNIGRGQTHKVKIVNLYLGGHGYREIWRQTRHSSGAIKRYLESFVRVAFADRHGVSSRSEISRVTGLSEYLVGQYKHLLRQVEKDEEKASALGALLERCGYIGGIKKTVKSDGLGMVVRKEVRA